MDLWSPEREESLPVECSRQDQGVCHRTLTSVANRIEKRELSKLMTIFHVIGMQIIQVQYWSQVLEQLKSHSTLRERRSITEVIRSLTILGCSFSTSAFISCGRKPAGRVHSRLASSRNYTATSSMLCFIKRSYNNKCLIIFIIITVYYSSLWNGETEQCDSSNGITNVWETWCHETDAVCVFRKFRQEAVCNYAGVRLTLCGNLTCRTSRNGWNNWCRVSRELMNWCIFANVD